jgi:hypothetical protein
MSTAHRSRGIVPTDHRHPTSDCIDFMRRELAEKIGGLDVIRHIEDTVPALRRQFKTATADSGKHFPSMAEFQRENWGPWQNALASQIANASRGQIATYFAEATGIRSASDCPVCIGQVRYLPRD